MLPLEVARIGVREASAFTGFCAEHDRTTFEPLDRGDVSHLERYAFLASYRSVCREVHYKLEHLEKGVPLFDAAAARHPRDPHRRQLEVLKEVHRKEVQAGLGELQRIKGIMDRALLAGRHDALDHYVADFSSPIQVVCSGAFIAECDFEGNLVQEVWRRDHEFAYLALSLSGTSSGGVAVLTSIGRDEVHNPGQRVIMSLDRIPDHALSSAFVRMAFEFLENVYFGEGWWADLGPEVQKALRARAHAGLPSEQFWHDLRNDGLTLASWQVRDRHNLRRGA